MEGQYEREGGQLFHVPVNQASGSYALVASALWTASHSDQSVQSGTTYYYVLTAVDDQGPESLYSNESRAVIP